MSYAKVLVTLAAAIVAATPAAAQMTLPTNVSATCVVEPATFSTWLAEGGGFKAANSVGFPTDHTACDFYAWGAQMFLWLTSPAGTGLVLDSPALFNVLPPDGQNQRLLQANPDTDAPVALELRAEKFDDDVGEVGQAGGADVLLSQGGSLVYYGIHVNSLYAYFLTGQRSQALTQTVFPRNARDLADVTAYVNATFRGVTLPAPEALAMELKTSWVDLSSIPGANRGGFVTMEAVVPLFSRSADNMTWTENGTQTITLALTGMHIVGTVQNHPEFVWITYEHVLNAPDAAYYYMDAAGAVTLQPYNSAGTFLFMAANGAETPANVACQHVAGGAGAIQAILNPANATPVCPGGIVASNTVRTYPWGSPANSQDDHVVTNNTLLLSINNSVWSQLGGDDVRRNYVLTGGIWTKGESNTADAPIPNWTAFTPDTLRGSLFAANVTMETYKQGTSCFTCHADQTNVSFQPFTLSHIYAQIVPLTLPAP